MKKTQFHNNVLGFTLVELIVVISVIAILSTIAMISFSQAQASARDARRQQIMAGIQTALESYYSDWKAYPNSATFGTLVTGPLKAYLTGTLTDPSSACTTAPTDGAEWAPCPGSASKPTYTYDNTSTPYYCPSSSGKPNQSYQLLLTPESGGTVKPFCSP